MLLTLAASALANGQTSHQWITVQALDALPDGELADFLRDESVRDALLNGTMFPDGGYAVGDGYGEMAHWEPLQLAWLDWIVATYDPPYEGDAARHVAFFLGLLSHGMADQHYDSTFMERSKAWDPAESWACCSMDEATDVAFAAETEPGVVPEAWWPTELLPLFETQGHVVSEDTVDRGQALLGVAIGYVGACSEVDSTVEMYSAQFPWAAAHQLDPDVPGNPPAEAELVALYWQVAWARLNAEDAPLAPLGTVATPTSLDATSVEARVGVAFTRGLDPASLAVTVTDSGGLDHAVTASVFYGWGSHIVNLAPAADWAEDDYTVTFTAATSWDGAALAEPATLSFSTRPPEADPEPEASAPSEPPGGCRWGSSALLLLPLLARRRRG